MRRITPLLPVVLAALTLVACGADDDTGAQAAPLRVAASFYPVAEIAEAVGGDRAEVANLTPAGTAAHDLELAPDQLAQLERSDLVLYLGSDFQPAVQQAVGNLSDDVTRADLLEGVRLRRVDDAIPGVRGEVDGEQLAGRRDPHVWVDPALFAELVDEVQRAYAQADPGGADEYARNAAAYRAEIEALNDEFAATLKDCATRTLVTSHAAFGYLADRYDLEQAPIAGISPDDEPDPKSLAATARKAKADGVTTVFFESLVPKRLSETVAREVGARTDALDPVEGLTREQLDAGESYSSIQRDNLRRLKRGLGCTA